MDNMNISKETWDLLKENAIDPIRIGKSPSYDVTPSMVIDYMRENFGIIIDVRFSPQVVMKPQWHCNIYKINDVNYFYKVPAARESFHDMAESAIQFITKKYNFK